MSQVRTLSSPPGSIELLARAALPLVPGASKLPFVAGGGKEVPDLELALNGVKADDQQLKAYADVCGFGVSDVLPATYLHIRAFPLHMKLMTDGSFPFPAVGLVHLSNRITVHRPLKRDETYDLRVRATKLQPHPKGRTFSIVSEARVGEELVWEDDSTMLRRGKGSGEGVGRERDSIEQLPFVAEWKLPGDLGRRYGGVSGDRNPIHIHPYTARLFGFPKAIAHGMWTKARCLAALEGRLPDAYTVDVSFKRPILLPSKVVFAAEEQGGETRFQVRSAKKDDLIHLEGTVKP
jgi:MaoC like domain